MTGRIFRSIFFTALAVFLASVVHFMWVLYDHFSGVQQEQLRMQTALAAHGAANEGAGFFNELETDGFRVTWIGADGTVLFDSETNSADMENHLEREEIKQALESGYGESSRYSATLTERLFYCAERLPDGTVIRLSVTQNSLLTLILAMTQPILIIFAAAFVLSLAFASRLSKKIVKPLNELNLDEPLNNDSYDEIAPLLTRLNSQQQRIKKQSGELEQKRREFETVTTGMSEGIVLLNAKHEILSINSSAKKILGVENASIGHTILSLNRSIEIQDVLAKADNGNRSEKITQLVDGSYEISASPIISDGEVCGTALLFLDVTEKERAEQLRREFTANVSHELKTPLQTISGYAELMANGMVKPADMTDFSGKIYAESRRMIRLVDDIIKLSRLDEGAGDMQFENVDLYALAKETALELLPQAESANVSITVNGEPTVINGIPRLLREIAFNLCDNAIKYNRPGGSVTITVDETDGAARFCVSDTGIGVPSEHIGRIFERFYRVDKSRSKAVSGTGLGLSIVKHAALAHGATIETQSKQGVGTEITVRFSHVT
ncbi:MAG: ATP-binding protein [Bacteroides sp.]|nr:ATP-binding protein [Eubacterium sp.]MCM1417623.1 ATP-binding protein [Roseburia sp.]MCM1461665.1 ATP-binding protein [Bacteroides sp.]